MRKFLLASAAIAALIATPAYAQTNAGFTGPRAEVQLGAGTNDNGLIYGTTVGGDIAVSDRVTFGIDLTGTDVFEKNGRELGAGARLGVALNPSTQVFVRGGYTNLDTRHGNLDGFNAGGGLQLRLPPSNVFVSTEYRYTNYGRDTDSHAGLLGLGFRF